MKTFALPLLAACLASCAVQPVPLEVDVGEVHRGIMQGDGAGGWRVVKPGPELRFQADAQCKGPQQAACMWYGFEFDYTALKAPTYLECQSMTLSIPVSGEPKSVTHAFNLDLSEAAGHAQYKTRVVQDRSLKMVRIMTACTRGDLKRMTLDTKISGFN